MADWWMDDTEIAISYRLAKDRVYQIRVLAELNLAKTREVADKLVSLGELSEQDAELFLEQLSERRSATFSHLHEKALSLYKDGYSDGAVGMFLGVSKAAVKHWRHKNGYPPNIPAKGYDGIWRRGGVK